MTTLQQQAAELAASVQKHINTSNGRRVIEETVDLDSLVALLRQFAELGKGKNCE